MLARARQLTGPDFPLIGVGGIDSADTAWSKIAAGADLVQLYTGMVYQGPSLVTEIKTDLAERLRADGFRNVADAVGVDAGA